MNTYKIRELRKRKGWSQEQLSAESGLSLRTIQRIENGESEPTGHSLLQLTRALGVSPDDLMEWAPVENRGFLIVQHLSGFGILFHPVLGIILPLILWILKRDQIRKADTNGKAQLSFMITWVILIYAVLNIAAAGQMVILSWSFGDLLSAVFVERSWVTIALSLIYLYIIVILLINARRTGRDRAAWYLPAIPFLH